MCQKSNDCRHKKCFRQILLTSPYTDSINYSKKKRQSLMIRNSLSCTEDRKLSHDAQKSFFLMHFYISCKHPCKSSSFIYIALCFKLYRTSKHFLQDPNIFVFCSPLKILIGRGKISH